MRTDKIKIIYSDRLRFNLPKVILDLGRLFFYCRFSGGGFKMAILSFLELVRKYQEMPEEIESCDCLNCIYSRDLEYKRATGEIKYVGTFCFRENLLGKKCEKNHDSHEAGFYSPPVYIGKDFCGQGYFFDSSEED